MAHFDRRLRTFNNEDEMADFLFERKLALEMARLDAKVSPRVAPVKVDELKAERGSQRMPARIAAFQTPTAAPLENTEPKLPFPR